VSIIKVLTCSSELPNTFNSDHSHNPLVQGFIVDPTLNALGFSINILLIKYDFPVLYLPTIDIMPISSLISDKNLIASSQI